MSPRFAPVLTAAVVVLLVAGCAAAGVAQPGVVQPSAAPASVVTPTRVLSSPVNPTPVPVPSRVPTLPEPTPTPVIGDVDGQANGPDLTVEMVDADTVQATIHDPDAKAWRLVVSGTGALAADRWEIAVETGDVGPTITATEIHGGDVVDVMDLSGFADGTGAAGGCHSTLAVCLDSDGFRLPEDGDGRFSVRLAMPDTHTPLLIRGGTAGWPGEPFVLGPWRDTEAFPWGQG